MGTFLVVQWLRLHAPNAGGTGSIPGQGTKIPQATEQLSPQARTREFKHCSERPCMMQQSSHKDPMQPKKETIVQLWDRIPG